MLGKLLAPWCGAFCKRGQVRLLPRPSRSLPGHFFRAEFLTSQILQCSVVATFNYSPRMYPQAPPSRVHVRCCRSTRVCPSAHRAKKRGCSSPEGPGPRHARPRRGGQALFHRARLTRGSPHGRAAPPSLRASLRVNRLRWSRQVAARDGVDDAEQAGGVRLLSGTPERPGTGTTAPSSRHSGCSCRSSSRRRRCRPRATRTRPRPRSDRRRIGTPG